MWKDSNTITSQKHWPICHVSCDKTWLRCFSFVVPDGMPVMSTCQLRENQTLTWFLWWSPARPKIIQTEPTRPRIRNTGRVEYACFVWRSEILPLSGRIGSGWVLIVYPKYARISSLLRLRGFPIEFHWFRWPFSETENLTRFCSYAIIDHFNNVYNCAVPLKRQQLHWDMYMRGTR